MYAARLARWFPRFSGTSERRCPRGCDEERSDVSRRSSTTHTEQLGDEASVYDWARAEVHALNPTAARVWRLCDGATSPEAIAAVLRVEMGIPEAEAVVDLALAQLARVHLLELPVESRGDRPATTRRWLLGRGLAAAHAAGDLLDRGAVSRRSAVAGGRADARRASHRIKASRAPPSRSR